MSGVSGYVLVEELYMSGLEDGVGVWLGGFRVGGGVYVSFRRVFAWCGARTVL